MHTNGKHSSDPKKLDGLVKKALADFGEKGKALFSEGVQSAREVIREKKDTLKQKAAELNNKTVAEITEELAEAIRSHPLKSIAVAAGVGMVIGLLFRRKNSSGA